MSKSLHIERLRNRSARQARKEDLLDIYCALTGAKGGAPFPGSTDDLRRAIAAHLCADLAANSDAPEESDEEPECMGHVPSVHQQGYPSTEYCDGSCRRLG
jgi:hypothetical protein